jgi:hypothetical protein
MLNRLRKNNRIEKAFIILMLICITIIVFSQYVPPVLVGIAIVGGLALALFGLFYLWRGE